MRYKTTKSDSFSFITSDSREADSSCAFLADELSKKYLDRVNGATILYPSDLKSYFDTDIKIIGITGTNGKTTTAAIMYSLLLDLGYKVAMQGTRGFFVNGEMVEGKTLTTPMLLDNYARIDLAKRMGCEYFITEVSSHAIVQKRLDGLDFALKIHTNITSDHLDFHKTIDEYRAVKNSFFADETPKLINKDDQIIRFNLKNARSYGIETPATYKIEAFSANDGLSAVVTFANERTVFYSSLVGNFNLYNILAAISAVHILTAKPLDLIAKNIENFGGVVGRLEVVSKDPLVVVDFAHTADGIEKALLALFPKEMIVVFGAGGDRDSSKRAPMGAMVARFAKKIVITSDNPRSEDPIAIIEMIRSGLENHKNYKIVPDRKEAIATALDWVEGNEVVVILGKGDETTQEIMGNFLPFNDKEVVQELLKDNNVS